MTNAPVTEPDHDPTWDAEVPTEEGVHQLPDGRELAWNSVGSGPTVIWCHGSNGGRLDTRYSAPRDGAVRVVAFDRPGQGRSSRLPGRSMRDGARDVESLADALGIERFAVLGYSSGGPHALVAGAVLTDRVIAVGVVAGLPPLDAAGLAATPGPAPLFQLARSQGVAALEQALAGLYPADSTKVDAFLAQFDGLPDGDYLRANPEVRALVVDTCVDSMQQGPGGWADDHYALASDWGVEWRALDETPVTIWQGAEDPLCTPATAQLIVERVPHAVVHLVPGRGHFGWITEMAKITASLVH
ncbi:MAG TPA: alpha/beta hydrolase [Acidimicrobiales bacterium]|nr:alpha/beta hydrolase [Acidimicrobiales bacterium]